MTIRLVASGPVPDGAKMRRSRVRLFARIAARILACLLVAAISLVVPGAAMAEETDVTELPAEGSFILDARARIEVVDDADLALEKGRASTFRARVGYETRAYGNFGFLVEGAFVQRAGMVTFNDTVNGKTEFAVIADPNVAQLNRAQVTYTGIPDTIIIAGRQRIILDDGRFVGNDGFRQNEQTFDAVRLVNRSFEDIVLSYTFIGGVNRIFGGDSAVGRFTGETHLFRASYAGLPLGTITGYVYLVDLEQAPLESSKTFGVRVIGIRHPWPRVQINYGFEFATQRSYGGNPQEFDLGYLMSEVGAAYDGEQEAISVTAKVEWLDGGTFRGFSTPLGSLHEFQGFMDRYTITPGTGVRDLQGSVAYDMKDVKFADNVRLSVWFHKFFSVTGEGSLGREVNASAEIRLTDRLTFTMQYADFNARTGGADRDGEIIWATLGFKY